MPQPELKALLGAVMALLLAVVAWFAWTTQQVENSRTVAGERELQTMDVLFATSEILSAVQDIETGQRGFLLTLDETFLTPYNVGRKSLPDDIARLRALVADSTEQQNRIVALESLISTRLRISERGLSMARDGTSTDNIRLQMMQDGKAAMDGIRQLMDRIVRHEQQLLAINKNAANESSSRVNRYRTLFSVLGLLLVALVGAAFWALLRQRRDVMDQRVEMAAAQRVAEGQQLMQMVIDSSDDPIYVKDRQGGLLYANQRLCDIYRAPLDALIGRPASDFLPAEAAAQLARVDQQIMETGIARTVEETLPDGGSDRVFLSAKAPWKQDGTVIGLIGISRDITERKLAERKLQSSNVELEAQIARRTASLTEAVSKLERESAERETAEARLRQLEKMESLGKLTGGIAHDFNNMLAIVMGSLDMARRRLSDDSPAGLRAALENAQEGAERAASLTSRLLAYSRQQPLAPQTIDTNELISSVGEVLSRTLGDSIELVLELAPDGCHIHIDRPQLESALINLAVNARDAMPRGGRLTISGRCDDGVAKIAMTDTGSGIDPEIAGKVFDPFFTTKEVGKGTGLGLSQVHGFVVQSGGDISIRSDKGEGTTVELSFPIASERVAAELVPEADGEPEQRTRACILVVEDEPLVRMVAVETLRELEHDVHAADSGEAALKILAGHPDIDLLLTDISMPHMDGRELAEKALALRGSLRVLFTTGYDAHGMTNEAHLLHKPYSADDLAAAVDRIMAETRA